MAGTILLALTPTFFVMSLTVFGVITLLIGAVSSRDYIVIQAIVLMTALLYLVLNALVDRSYPLLDPRVRKGRAW